MKILELKTVVSALAIWTCLLSSGFGQSEALSREVAVETYAKADKLLNQTYRDLNKLLDATEKKELLQKQKAWLKKRDLLADKAAKPLKGTNMYNRHRNETLMELTVKRYAELLIEYYHVYERVYYRKDDQ